MRTHGCRTLGLAVLALLCLLAGSSTASARTVTWKRIVSPTKQISCFGLKYGGPGIICSAPFLPRIGEFDPYYGLKPHGKAISSQISDYPGYPGQNHTLHYGDTWKWKRIACTMATTGLTCSNLDRHGFHIARGANRLFSTTIAPPARAATTCSVSSDGRNLGPTYVTSLSVTHTTCSTGVSLVKAFYKCRTAHGVAGRCVKKVNGYACTETRQSIPTQFSAKVTCRKGRAKVVHTYTQFT